MTASPETLQAPPLGSILQGRTSYELVRFLGAGTMGAVYEALCPNGERVAVKVLLEEALRRGGRKAYDRFRREAEVTATLDSPNILRTVDAAVDPTFMLAFMVMPLLVGADLDDLMGRIGPIHPTVAARVGRQVCAALALAHRSGVVHRDIKPANVFLDYDRSGNVTVRVLDFGIAKWRSEDTNITRTAALLGTPLFMSPEQTRSAKYVDPRSDIWSVGLTLYAILTHTVPFGDAHNLPALYMAIATRDVPPLQDAAPWVAPGLAAIVHGTLLRDPDKRCPSADALAEALALYTEGSDDLTAAMLSRLPAECLEERAPRASLPTAWSEVEIAPAPVSRVMGLAKDEVDPLLGQTLAGRYELLRCIGRGGMGAVYEALGPEGTRYAVKVIQAEGAAGKEVYRKRFVREARAVSSIVNEHIVRVVEADTDPLAKVPYLVMELLRGLDLDALVDRQGALMPKVGARLITQACRGLAAAHALGFVHRDIKPANLFLQQSPSGEVIVKICDFGIVKQLLSDATDAQTAALTSTGGVVGSPMYMSPEQAMDARTADHRTDVWSLGASLYHVLSGSVPWKGRSTVAEIIVALCTREPEPIETLAPWIAPGLGEIIRRAMTRDIGARLQSVEELALALEPFTGGRTDIHQEDLAPVPQHLRDRYAARPARKPASVPVGPALSSGVSSGSGPVRISAAPAGAAAASPTDDIARTLAAEPGHWAPADELQVLGSASTSSGAPSALELSQSAALGASAGGTAQAAVGTQSAAAASLTTTSGQAATKGLGRWAMLAAAGVLLVSSVGAFVALRPSASKPTSEAASSATAGAEQVAASVAAARPVASPQTFRAEVRITPATAAVTVNGARQELVDGSLLLIGEPGDKFAVVLSDASRKLASDVTIAKDGKASPDRLALADEPAAPAAASHALAAPSSAALAPVKPSTFAPPPPVSAQLAAPSSAPSATLKPRSTWQ